MNDISRFRFGIQRSCAGLIVMATLALLITGCGFPRWQPRRSEAEAGPQSRWTKWPKPNEPFQEASLPILRAEIPVIPDAEYVNDDELCVTCHQVYAETFTQNVHHGIQEQGQSCEACHGPASRHLETRGQEPGLLWNFKTMPAAQQAEVCLTCHEENACSPGAQWRTSVHAHSGLSCSACHTSHYNVPTGTPATTEPDIAVTDGNGVTVQLAQYSQPLDRATMLTHSQNLGAISPNICYRCHANTAVMEQVASSHQVCGCVGFDCSTCHEPHGKLRQETRTDLCLQCHQNDAHVMAWHSSTHSLVGVACTDCHNPHPDSNVPAVVGISHTSVSRPQRMPMSVSEPDACYKCHPAIYAKGALPSHHPIKEGKMVCSDCHDAHGQYDRNLKEMDGTMVCYRCHAEKQGPFVHEHPPVKEDCGICHEAHGTVANNLLRQPATFLCLRCHSGHRKDNRNPDPTWLASGDGAGNQTLRSNPTGLIVRAAEYSDCTQCHSQVHGSDLPSNTGRSTFLR